MPDNFASMTNPDGSCCDEDAPACPQYVVTVVGVAGQPVGGLAVALAGTLDGQPWTRSGTTDGSGSFVYTMPSQAPYPIVTTASVAAPDYLPAKGCTATGSFGAECLLRFTYCRTTVRAQFSAEVMPTLSTTQPAGQTIPWSVTRDNAAGVIVWDLCCLKLGVSPPGTQNPLCRSYNTNIQFRADDPTFHPTNRTGRPPRCAGVLVNCGVQTDIDLRQEPYPECYDLGACGPVQCGNVGPPYLGAIPRRIQVRLTTVGPRQDTTPYEPDTPKSCNPLFAGDDGVWIDLFDLDSGQRGGMGNFTRVAWTFGGNANFSATAINCPCTPPPPPPRGYLYGCRELGWDATRVRITPDLRGNGNTFNVVYYRINTGYDPSHPTVTRYNFNTDQYEQGQDEQTFNISGAIPYSALCVPIPTTAYQCVGQGGSFTVEFRDGCALDPYDSSASSAQPMMMAAPPMAMAAPAPSPALRVGLITPWLVAGGAEDWQLTLIDATRARLGSLVEWVGAACIHEDRADPGMVAALGSRLPLAWGWGAGRDLAARCDLLVTWHAADYRDWFDGLESPPRTLFACHTPNPGFADAVRLATCDRFAAVSDSALAALPDELRGRAVVIPNAVDPSRLAASRSREEVRAGWGVGPGDKVVLQLGRLDPEKNPRAALALAKAAPGLRVVLVGDGSLRVSLEAEAPGNCRIAGSDVEKGSVLRAADVLLVPSHYESFGLALAEAWEAGLPVVAAPVGLAADFPEAVRPIPHGADGPTIAGAVAAALADHDGTRRRVEAGRLAGRSRFGVGPFARGYSTLMAELAPDHLRPALRAAAETDPPETVPVGESLRRLAAVKACPHRSVPSCGCSPGRCALGKGRGGDVTVDDCMKCQGDGGPTR